MEEEREEGERGEVRRRERVRVKESREGMGKNKKGRRKRKSQGEEEGNVEKVEKNVMGWTWMTRSAKPMRRMVQIFVKVDE